MILLLVAAAVAAAAPQSQLDEAAFAIEAGRLDQARTMIAKAVADGAAGPALDRLLADLAFATGDYPTALGAYQQLLLAEPGNGRLLERAGISALHLRRDEEASRLLRAATAGAVASWRAWNALGVAADRRGDWAEADRAYHEAVTRAPEQAVIANNHGWSLLLRGSWGEAVARLEQASQLDPKSRKIADNLELARAAVAEDLPRRRPGESDRDWAARLNDAGVIARIRGDRKRALAAFAQAIEVRSQWFERAANNLAQVEPGK